jgi:hypothetical protein
MALIKTSAQGLASDATNLVLLSSATLSGDTEVVFNNSIITSTYKSYIIRGVHIHTSADNISLNFQVSDDNGSSYKNSDYKRSIHVLVNNLNSNTFISRQGSSDVSGSFAGIYEGIGNDTGESLDFEIQLFDPKANNDTQTMVKTNYQSNNGRFTLNHGNISHGAVASINTIKFYPSSGNFAEGTISIYGVKT